MTDAENKKPHIYEESTQYRHWRFSPEQLWEIRNNNTTNAINRLQKYNQEHEEAPNADNPETGNIKEYLTAKEELQLCRFYEKQLQIMSKHCKFNDMVMATAVIYMKRFYLHNSTMDYHPKDIFLTCLFLATKSESERISIEDFGKKLRLPSTKDVLGLEFTVSQGLKFQYYVHHPYRPAYGFFLDMQTGPIDTKLLKETYKKVERTIAEILLTDLPLIYQPAQLALAAFMQAGKENEFDKQIERYITDRFRDDATNLLSIIERILALFKTSTPVTQEEAKKIDYKLKLCTANNPESAM
ncbi:MAG: cyclin-like protein [Benjaminiella poitrasii]|nr:MAG: cyclin-like protein [Benjaminiella poitrasii]